MKDQSRIFFILLEGGPKAHCVEDLSLKSYFNKRKEDSFSGLEGFPVFCLCRKCSYEPLGGEQRENSPGSKQLGPKLEDRYTPVKLEQKIQINYMFSFLSRIRQKAVLQCQGDSEK